MAGLFDALKQYIADALPGGSLNPEQQPVAERANYLSGLLDPNSQVSADARNWHGRVQNGLVDQLAGNDTPAARYANDQMMNIAGVAPLGMIRSVVGRIPETMAETTALADMLRRAGERAGYQVSHEGSTVSPSQYVTFIKAADDAGDLTRQVRISNHADKYPELANGVRTSVDPATEVSFEQAVNWLGREGFPTSLSTRYRDVPTWEQYYAARRAKEPPVDPEVLLKRLQWHWENNPSHDLYKGTGVSKPTMDDALAWIAKFK